MITEDESLYSFVSLRPVSEWSPEQGCPAWVESAGRTCGKEPTKGYLCARHHTAAYRRMTRAHEKRREQNRAASEYRAKMTPQWAEELERVEAEIARRDQPVVNDRAAVGGVVHPSIRKKQKHLMSDKNVSRMAELHRRAEELRRKIGAA